MPSQCRVKVRPKHALQLAVTPGLHALQPCLNAKITTFATLVNNSWRRSADEQDTWYVNMISQYMMQHFMDFFNDYAHTKGTKYTIMFPGLEHWPAYCRASILPLNQRPTSWHFMQIMGNIYNIFMNARHVGETVQNPHAMKILAWLRSYIISYKYCDVMYDIIVMIS